ncbi:MAG: hypothetical protein RJQ09_00880 [Cyclobacteriaceae bacterium]
MKKGLIKGIVVTIMFLTFGTLTNEVRAQYKTGAGLRFGGTSGVSLKHFYKPNAAYEGILGIFNNGFSITGLIERSAPAFDAPGLYWYYGAGAHVALYDNHGRLHGFGRDINDRDSDDIGLGIDGIVGLEYKIPDNVPLSISMGLKPFLEIDSDGDWDLAPDPAITIRYIFK